MNRFRPSTLALLSLLALSACSRTTAGSVAAETDRPAPVASTATPAERPRNVIFIIGDGMGTAQVYSSIVNQGGNRSQFLRFPYTGFSRTYSANRYTTDSGAGGTALLCGQKIDNQAVGYTPEGLACPSLLVTAHERGLATGFVVTSSVLDATPASTYAHVPHRKMFDTISMQMAHAPFDLMIGGDRNHFLPRHRHDGLAPLDTLRQRGYTLALTLAELQKVAHTPLCALLTPDDPSMAGVRDPLLTEGVSKALALLPDSSHGFMLMIEGSQIDWACHNNDTAYLRQELNDFEQMLRLVLDYAQADGQTLVVVTADHETGGTTLLTGDIAGRQNTIHFVTEGHTGIMVPVFAFGPGAHLFSGIQENTDVYRKVKQLLLD